MSVVKLLTGLCFLLCEKYKFSREMGEKRWVMAFFFKCIGVGLGDLSNFDNIQILFPVSYLERSQRKFDDIFISKNEGK
jgi:hypothetical protein